MDFQALQAEIEKRQQKLAPIHEAGHAVAAIFLGLRLTAVDVHPGPNRKCGSTRLGRDVPPFERSIQDEFDVRNVQLLAGAAAEAEYFLRNNIPTVQGLGPYPPENWENVLEFSANETFAAGILEHNLTPQLALFLNETGASGDWADILRHFHILPYSDHSAYSTPELRNAYIKKTWIRAVTLVRTRWNSVELLSDHLRTHKELSAVEIFALVKHV